MENKEWLNDYEQLKRISTTNPFKVPEGYFNELSDRINMAIKLDEMKNTISPDHFTVPQNYFENLADNIQSRIVVEELLNLENTGLTVPEDYFNELSSNIQSRIAVEEALLNSDEGLTVPEGYFETLNDNIQAQLTVAELMMADSGLTIPEGYFENLSNSIQSRIAVEEVMAGTTDTFTVPEGYFNRLNKEILNQTVNKDVVKRKGAVIRMLSTNAFKYATAACLVLMVGGGVFLKVESPEAIHDRSFLHKELSTIPVSDIQNYLEQNMDGSDTQHTVATEDLSVNTDDLKAALQDYTDQ
ncbi:hypothetical protein [Mucilaginibacter sp. dw_454]|uniref:hypothetical protein n=1 Tax=Mucilaginibacter sp. dw_454 TaxID=2720079 RepID=UPI001BD3AB59|nr:hypothetical protein [Mucilaginibacter sp. dw_454]